MNGERGGFSYAEAEEMKTNCFVRGPKSAMSRSTSAGTKAMKSTTTSNRSLAESRLHRARVAGVGHHRPHAVDDRAAEAAVEVPEVDAPRDREPAHRRADEPRAADEEDPHVHLLQRQPSALKEDCTADVDRTDCGCGPRTDRLGGLDGRATD